MSEVDLTNIEYCDPFNEEQYYWMRVEHLGRYYYVLNNIDEGLKLLDIACANGYGTKLLSKKCDSVTGIDKNEGYISLARSTNNSSNITYKVLDIDVDDIKGVYDYVTCFETLEHVKYPRLLLNKLYNALSDDGIMFLSVPNSKYEVIENGKNKDPYHIHAFEYNELLEMIKEVGFIISDILGQSMTNMIVNNEIIDIESKDLITDSLDIGYPNDKELEKTYSYLFVLKK